jgi:2-oxoglutarate ferredoxin oxidoreductase subunit delta
MARGRVTFDESLCKGCSLCVLACPPKVIRMDLDRSNAKGYHPAVLDESEANCTGCALCAVICPDVVITVFRSVAAAA